MSGMSAHFHVRARACLSVCHLFVVMRHLGSVSNQKSVTLRLLPLEVEIQLFGARKWDLRAILGLKHLTK